MPDKDGILIESGATRRIRKRRASGFGKDSFSADFGNNMFLITGASPVATSPTARDIYSSTFDMELKIKNLELLLEKSQAANAALHIDLDKERSAAASAADEAMAMIYRLQSEKANFEMESRQLQRIIQEKSMYDEEEMNILKEIIVRREMEKHALVKELEAYRQLTRELKPKSEFNSDDDLALMLKSAFESIEKNQNGDDLERYNIECKEKDIITLHVYPSDYCESSSIGDTNIRYELDKDDKDEIQNIVDSCVLDVHVIEDENSMVIKENEKAHCENDGLTTKTSVENFDSESSRNSLFTVDNEKVKLEKEVEILRKRLKAIQEGKRTLSTVASELQILDEIREITEPEKKIRQVSLPPLYPKVFTRKRRCCSVSSLSQLVRDA